MTKEKQKAVEKCANCVHFCSFCEEEFKMGACKEFNVRTAIAACSLCGTYFCKDHSEVIRRGKRRCRDQKACHSIMPDHDEGGGD